MAEGAVEQSYDEDDLLPISALQHLLFCERRAALVYVERLWDENEFTARGTVEHERVHEGGTEARGDVVTARGLRLRSLRLGLTGQADVVEYHRCLPGESVRGLRLQARDGLWQPVPVEYKSGRNRIEEGYEVQLCAQALCLEEMLSVPVKHGALYYAASARRDDLAFTDELRRRTESAVARLHHVLESRDTPSASAGPKCRSCSLMDVCLPEISHHHSVAQYLSETILVDAENGA